MINDWVHCMESEMSGLTDQQKRNYLTSHTDLNSDEITRCLAGDQAMVYKAAGSAAIGDSYLLGYASHTTMFGF